jgi:Ca2+-binding RTX toxin-like protein
MPAIIDLLEPRALLTATLSPAGLLTITGTPAADKISMTRTQPTKTKPAYLVVSEKIVTPKPGGAGQLTTIDTTNFLLAGVKTILVNAGDGNDSVSVAGGTKYKLALPATLNGGNGNDSLTGGQAGDLIHGNAGDDLIAGGDANDALYGDEGKDRLTGGQGADHLYGGAGQDRLYSSADNAIDTLDGGALTDNDYAMTDVSDIVLNVKRIKHPTL